MEEILIAHPAYRGRQARAAVFRRLVSSWEEASDLPLELRALLDREVPLMIPHQISQSSDGGTAKAALTLADGETIETVLMRHRGQRNTVCVSSQVGCPLGCDFCLTGAQGYTRNLTQGEIVSQVLFWSRFLRESSERVSNVVFMGMGEPLLNYAPVLQAIRIFNDPAGLEIGARRISISTAGIVEGIDRLGGEGLQFNLSLSLHAPDNQLRSRLMPINRTYPIEAVLPAAARYIEKTGRRLMIEYLLLAGVNDSPDQAVQLAACLREYFPRLFFVNLIVYNQTGKYLPPEESAVREFVRVLEEARIAVTRRFRFGDGIRAACGQLAGEGPALA